MGDSLGSRLRARRIERGLKLSDVANATGLSMQYVSNLERDRGNPTLKALTAIADSILGDLNKVEKKKAWWRK